MTFFLMFLFFFFHLGSPGESLALVSHLESLGPKKRQKEEVRELLEVLLILKEEPLAKSLQRTLGALEECHLAAMEKVVEIKVQEEGPVSLTNEKGTPGTKEEEKNFKWKLLVLDS